MSRNFYVFKPGAWADLSLPDDFSNSSLTVTQTGLDVVRYETAIREQDRYYETDNRFVEHLSE